MTGIDLMADPGRTMEMDLAATFLIEGMCRGSFTGRRLNDFFESGSGDWGGVRNIINGVKRPQLVAGTGGCSGLRWDNCCAPRRMLF